MLGFELTGTTASVAMLIIVSITFVLFIREKHPPEVIAIASAATMMVLGLLPVEDAAGVLSNAAPWTIAFMYLLMGGLMRTGALDLMSSIVSARADTNPMLAVASLFGFVIVASAVMNNTPVVAVMIPICIQLALRLGTTPSKLLMPLSYFTLMGGMISLIGTSTNLLVDGVARERGMEPFTIFEIAPVGIAITLAGIAYFLLIGRKLLPERTSLAGFLGSRREMKYFTEVAIPEDSSLVDQTVTEVALFKRDAVRLIDVLRGDASLRRDLDSVVLQPGDRILALGGQPVESWRDIGGIAQTLPVADHQDWTVRRDGAELTVRGPDPMPARISGVAPRSAAADAGLRAGDVVMAIEGRPVSRFSQLRAAVEAAEGQPVALQVWRPGAGVADYTLVPKMQDLPAEGGGYERRWLIGVTGGESFFAPATRSAGPLESLWLGVVQTWGIVTSSLSGMWAMISGQIGTCNLGGAISIAESTGQAASAGGANFLWWIAVLSAAIGFLNLLPIPVLDGGHLMFYTYEAVRGRPPSDKALNLLTAIGMAAVLSLMIFGLTNDLFCP